MFIIQERRRRLSPALYRGAVAVSFTACIKGRIPVFSDMEVFNALSHIFVETLNRWDCDAHIFLFMPDHCHLLIQGKTDDSDLLGLMMAERFL